MQLEKLDAMQTTVVDISKKLDLASLKRADGAKYNSYDNQQVVKCLEGTRVELLQRIMDWIKDPQQRILWLCGNAGTGKSTVAKTVATTLKEILVTFFFKRGIADRNNARRLFPTLIGQLMDAIPSLKSHVAEALRSDSTICDSDISTQFRMLLEQPLNKCHTIANIYIVLDALDECSRQDVREVLTLLSTLNPPGIEVRIFVTSRPDVAYAFRNTDRFDMKLEEVDETVLRHDLRLYIDHEFKSMRSHSHDDWPKEHQLVALTEISMPLFIAASTYCQYISKLPERRLTEIIDQRPDINEMYLPILCNMQAEYSFDMALYHNVVGAIVLIYNPLSVEALVELLDVRTDDVHIMLDDLRSILNVEDVVTFHLSFRDYLMEPKKPHDFCIDRTRTHDNLFRHCVRLLDTLEYDICHVGHIGTLRKKFKPNIAPEIQYACQYWTLHASDEHKVEDFLRRGLLHWLEAMSWLDSVPQAIWNLTALSRRWPENQFLTDSVRFIVAQQTPIELAPLQVYITALHLTSSQSLVKQCYVNVFRERAKPWFDRIPEGTSSETVIWNRPFVVVRACLSHDKQFIGLCCVGGTVRHCEVATGTTRQSFDTNLHVSYAAAKHLHLAYSLDGLALTIAYGEAVLICDIGTGTTRPPYQTDAEIIALAADGSMAIIVHNNSSTQAVKDCKSSGSRNYEDFTEKTVSILHIASDRRSVLIHGFGFEEAEKAEFSSFDSNSIVLLTDIVQNHKNVRGSAGYFRIWTIMAHMLPALLPNAWNIAERYLESVEAFSLSQSGLLAFANRHSVQIYDICSGGLSRGISHLCDFERYDSPFGLQFIQHDEAAPLLLLHGQEHVRIYTISDRVLDECMWGDYPGRQGGWVTPVDSYHSTICNSSSYFSMSTFLPRYTAVGLSGPYEKVRIEVGLRPDYFYTISGSKLQFWHVDGHRIGGVLDCGTKVWIAILTQDHLYGLTVPTPTSERIHKVWSTKSNKVIYQIATPSKLKFVMPVLALSPDAELLVMASSSKDYPSGVLDTRAATITAELPDGAYERASFSQDGRYLCAAESESRWVPTIDGYELPITLAIFDLHGHSPVIRREVFLRGLVIDVHWAGQCLFNQAPCSGDSFDLNGHEIHVVAGGLPHRNQPWLAYGGKRFFLVSQFTTRAQSGRRPNHSVRLFSGRGSILHTAK